MSLRLYVFFLYCSLLVTMWLFCSLHIVLVFVPAVFILKLSLPPSFSSVLCDLRSAWLSCVVCLCFVFFRWLYVFIVDRFGFFRGFVFALFLFLYVSPFLWQVLSFLFHVVVCFIVASILSFCLSLHFMYYTYCRGFVWLCCVSLMLCVFLVSAFILVYVSGLQIPMQLRSMRVQPLGWMPSTKVEPQ